MPVTLKKGGNISLSRADASLKKVLIGLGWDSRVTNGADYDLDATAFMLTESGKVRNDNEMIFYNQLSSPCRSLTHTGDNRTGDGDGDDESLIIELEKIPSAIAKISVTVTIDDAEARRQNFGQVSDAFIRVVNEETNIEICRFDLSEDYSTETAMIFGEIYRSNGEWKFKAVGQGFNGGLEEMCRQFGVNVS
jgi:tellurium resistance protein TerD